jgi:diphthine synthase
MLYIIGIGLWSETDITLKGLEAVKKCSDVYLECYTSQLGVPVQKLEELYGKKIIMADRQMVEQGTEILEKAAKTDVALLIIGDIFSATTHIDIFLRAKEKGINVITMHNASILTAIGSTGLDLYRFGRVVSIPFHHQNLCSPADAIRTNLSIGFHTLVLLDLAPLEGKFLQIKEAAEYLLSQGFDPNMKCLGCAGIGSESPELIYAELSKLIEMNFSKVPQCIIVPGKLHFIEEEALKYIM